MAGVGFLAASDVLAKLLAADYATTDLVFWRAVFALPLLLVLAARARVPGAPLLHAPRLQLLRGLAAFAAIALFFEAIDGAPLANLTAVAVTAPMMMATLGVLVLGERLKPWLWGVLALGCGGVLLVVRPGAWREEEAGAYLLVLGSALAYAVAGLLTRQIGRRDPAATSSLVTYLVMLGGAVLLGLPELPRLPRAGDLALFVLLGAAGALGMLVYTLAYRFSGLSGLACWDNVIFVWALLFGALVFGEVPTSTAIAGGTVTMLAAIAVTHFR